MPYQKVQSCTFFRASIPEEHHLGLIASERVGRRLGERILGTTLACVEIGPSVGSWGKEFSQCDLRKLQSMINTQDC